MQPDEGREPARVAVVATDPAVRQSLTAILEDAPDVAVVAWADALELLLLLGTRMDVCVCPTAPAREAGDQLREQGGRVVVVPAGADPAEVVRRELSREAGPEPGRPAPASPPSRRPRLAPRQREVLVAYVAGSELLPTVARQLGMDRETLKTHLRRIRAKYRAVDRPAPTRRDLYIRAVEDGLIPPPTEHGPAGPDTGRRG